jgi:fatty-acyl-CoA synthase
MGVLGVLGSAIGHGSFHRNGCLHADHAYVSCPCLGPALCGHHAGGQAGLPRPLSAGSPCWSWWKRSGSLSHTASLPFCICFSGIPMRERIDLCRLEADHRRGMPCRKALCLEAMQRGIDVFAGYGMSETCPILTICPSFAGDAGSAGLKNRLPSAARPAAPCHWWI